MLLDNFHHFFVHYSQTVFSRHLGLQNFVTLFAKGDDRSLVELASALAE